MKNRIREVMQKANLSQQDFAAKLGVSPASISNIFIGRTNPTITHAFAVHKAFPEVSMNWLLFGEGEMADAENSSPTLYAVGTDNGEILDLGDAGLTFPEGSVSTPANVALLQKTSPAVASAPQVGSIDPSANFRNAPQIDVPDFASQNRFPTYNDLQNAKNVDKPERRVKEIRVFYDDGTYEIFIPAMK